MFFSICSSFFVSFHRLFWVSTFYFEFPPIILTVFFMFLEFPWVVPHVLVVWFDSFDFNCCTIICFQFLLFLCVVCWICTKSSKNICWNSVLFKFWYISMSYTSKVLNEAQVFVKEIKHFWLIWWLERACFTLCCKHLIKTNLGFVGFCSDRCIAQSNDKNKEEKTFFFISNE